MEIEEVTTSSADEVLDLLDPRNPRWRADPRSWVFRGHADGRWNLHPTITREAVERGKYAGQSGVSFPLIERSLIAIFVDELDRTGLPIPFDSPQLRKFFPLLGRTIHDGDPDTWPQPEVLPLLALAQHHGVQTRLLDWTYDIKTAAYFAAKGAAQRIYDNPQTSGVLHVWAWQFTQTVQDSNAYVRRASPRTDKSADHETRQPDAWHIGLVNAPGAGNPNLQAQRGVFSTVWSLSPNPNDWWPPPTHDRVVLMQTARAAQATIASSPLLRISLPWEHAPLLLELLAKHGTSAASVFPGFGGAAAAVDERRHWHNKVWL